MEKLAGGAGVVLGEARGAIELGLAALEGRGLLALTGFRLAFRRAQREKERHRSNHRHHRHRLHDPRSATVRVAMLRVADPGPCAGARHFSLCRGT
jgi:hypothetical protein